MARNSVNWTLRPGRRAGGAPGGKTLARIVADIHSMLESEARARELSGPVRTLADMTPEQRAALERELGAPIRRRSGNTPGQVPNRRS